MEESWGMEQNGTVTAWKMMANMKRLQRLVALLGISILLLAGCDSQSSSDPRSSAQDVQQSAQVPVQASTPDKKTEADSITVARRMLSLGYWDAAAEAAYKVLVTEPENLEATLLAGEAEAGRKKFDLAAALASSIDVEWRLGERAVDLHARSLYELGRTSDSADVLLAALEKKPNRWIWRHRAWTLLNHVGRREEASLQAQALCRAGQANELELNSLIRRSESFPTKLKAGTEPSDLSEPGLGMARWYFTQSDYRRALEELKAERDAGFNTAAASALYGRLLAETQSQTEFPVWHAACDLKKVQPLGDYWAAVGTYFFDLRQYESSARALLEAVLRNPTDRLSIQRLAKVFDALGMPDQAEAFRQRGVELAQCETLSDTLQVTPANATAERYQTQAEIMQQLLQLERPFESLAWALRLQPTDAVQQRQALEQKRLELSRSDEVLAMAREASLLGADPNQYNLGAAYDELLSGNRPARWSPESKEVTPIARPRLVNVAQSVGLDFQWYQDLEINLASIPIHESIGGGIAVIDYDLDGWPDVFLAQGSGEPPTDACTRSDLLMRNRDGRFEDVTLRAGTQDFNYGSGLAAGDVNQDGFADLFVGSLGHNRLLINNGDGTFRDATELLGDVADRFTTSLAIADINGDALPDLYEAVYIEMEGGFALPKKGPDGRESQPSPLEHFAESDRWYENQGDGRFVVHEITREVARPGTGLGVVVTDFDNNGSNEVFVGNDVRPNHFLVQAGKNVLLNAADAKGVANGFSGAANGCMGIAAADFNLDGTLDLHITNFNQESNNLYLQSPSGGFTDFAIRYRLDELSMPYVGFGTKAIDIDRDGWLDLAITNGHIFDMTQYGEGYQMPPDFLMNRGTFFERVAVEDESGYWDRSYLGRTMAMLDYNQDGALDLLINHLDQPLALLRNETKTDGQSLQFELVGSRCERDAVGARVEIQVDGQPRFAWVTAGDGYMCSDEPLVEFGIPPGADVDRVEIRWPSGTVQTFDAMLKPGRYLMVEGQ